MLAVDAALVVESTGVSLRIDGHGDVVTCRVNADAAQWVKALLSGRSALRGFRTVIPVLIRAGIRLDIRAGRRRIACAGSGVRQDALARLLHLPAARLAR